MSWLSRSRKKHTDAGWRRLARDARAARATAVAGALTVFSTAIPDPAIQTAATVVLGTVAATAGAYVLRDKGSAPREAAATEFASKNMGRHRDDFERSGPDDAEKVVVVLGDTSARRLGTTGLKAQLEETYGESVNVVNFGAHQTTSENFTDQARKAQRLITKLGTNADGTKRHVATVIAEGEEDLRQGKSFDESHLNPGINEITGNTPSLLSSEQELFSKNLVFVTPNDHEAVQHLDEGEKFPRKAPEIWASRAEEYRKEYQKYISQETESNHVHSVQHTGEMQFSEAKGFTSTGDAEAAVNVSAAVKQLTDHEERREQVAEWMARPQGFEDETARIADPGAASRNTAAPLTRRPPRQQDPAPAPRTARDMTSGAQSTDRATNPEGGSVAQ